ncbi:Fic family protein [Pseudoscardovia radai]|uniref:Fic family protein n=1 Tax=Pseudoscardovia radai TaxID=987066 RepID=A0A261EWI0_9BIFI|nr:Fic family protein [Pseudoscardovia radai]OZG51203.1 Fic family protein [Pseudoscardovia radai]
MYSADAAASAAARKPEPCAVPAAELEEHYWTPSDDGYYSRTARRKASGNYCSTLPASIARISLTIPADLAADLDEATQQLVAFDARAAERFTAGGRTLGPLSAVLLRTESTSSSRIENLTVGARRLARESLDGSQGGNAALVVGNVRAMEAALEFAENLSEENILAMHAALLGDSEQWKGRAGRYRDQLVWVGVSSAGPRGASHVAPQPEQVPGCMADLIEFINRDDLPILAQCAIAHAQFETIHPFIDGNGRVGRALIHAMLRGKGLTPTMTPPVSAGILHDTARYFDALTAFREGDARPILECFSSAARYAARTGMELIDTLSGILDDDAARLHALPLRRNALGWALLPHVVEQPVVNAPYAARVLGATPASATRAIAQLERAGVLVKISGGRRGRVWEERRVLEALDDYAEMIRRG